MTNRIYTLASPLKCRGWTGFLMNLGFRPVKTNHSIPFNELKVQPMSLPSEMIWLAPRIKYSEYKHND